MIKPKVAGNLVGWQKYIKETYLERWTLDLNDFQKEKLILIISEIVVIEIEERVGLEEARINKFEDKVKEALKKAGLSY